MNKQHTEKKYTVFSICLALVSMLVLFATPFLTPIDPSGVFFFEDLEQWIVYGIIIAMLVCAVVNAFRALFSFFKLRDAFVIEQMLSATKLSLGCNIVYYLSCMYMILKMHDWDFVSVLSGDALVHTQSYLPMFMQLLIVYGVFALYNRPMHTLRSLASEAVPEATNSETSASETPSPETPSPEKTNPEATTENVPAKESVQPIQTNPTVASTSFNQAQTPPSPPAPVARDEVENMALLTKYKELLDSGVITEDDYNTKKKELLGLHTAATVYTRPSPNVQRTTTGYSNVPPSVSYTTGGYSNGVASAPYTAPHSSNAPNTPSNVRRPASPAMVQAAMMKFQRQIPTNCRPILQKCLMEASDECMGDLLNHVKIKRKMLTLFFSIFLGALGVDRFYLGDAGAGMGKLFLGISGFVISFFPGIGIVGTILSLITSIWCFVDIFVTYRNTKKYNYELLISYLKRHKATSAQGSYYRWGE